MEVRIGQVARAGRYCINSLRSANLVSSKNRDIEIKASLSFTTDQIVANIKNSHQYIDLNAICGYLEVYGFKAQVVNHFSRQMAIEVEYVNQFQTK